MIVVVDALPAHRLQHDRRPDAVLLLGQSRDNS